MEKRKCYHLPGGLPDWENNGDACMKWRRFGKYVICMIWVARLLFHLLQTHLLNLQLSFQSHQVTFSPHFTLPVLLLVPSEPPYRQWSCYHWVFLPPFRPTSYLIVYTQLLWFLSHSFWFLLTISVSSCSLFESSQSLFWASFGGVGIDSFELTGIKSYTRFWGLLMFGSYSVINVIVLLNLLIAMMSNSYAMIDVSTDAMRSHKTIFIHTNSLLAPSHNLCS